jgi:tetratricopeptide (TPR) repeat protein
MKTWFWPRTRVLMVLSFLGLLVYYNAVAHPFVHDDVVFVQMNPNIARWDNLAETFLSPGIPLQSLKITTPYYRPFLEILYRLQYLIFGMNPAGFHLFNVLLHILNAFLVFLLSLRLQLRKRWAFGIALMFLVHPVQTEAVACVSGISNLVLTGLVLGTLLAYWEARSRVGKQRRIWQAGALALCALALLSKEQAVVAPVLIVLYEFLWMDASYDIPGLSVWKGRSPAFNDIKRWIFPAVFFLLIGLYLLWRMYLFPGSFSEALQDQGELVLRLWAIPKTLLMYMGLIMWPAGLHYYRSVDVLAKDYAAFYGFAACVFFIIAVSLSMPERNRRWAWFGLGWFMVTLLPVANIVPLINEYSLILAAEHFLYLPLIGFLIFLTAVVGWLMTTLGGLLTLRFRWSLFVLAVIVLGALAMGQNRMWSDEVTLFERTVKYEPGLGRVRLLLGRAYLTQGRVKEALVEYSAGLQIMQGYAKKAQQSKALEVYLHYVKAAHFDRGLCYLALGDVERASEEFRSSLKTRLSYLNFPELQAQDSLTASNLGFNYIRSGDRAKAKECFMHAVQLDGRNIYALKNLGVWYMDLGDREMARFWFERALKVDPEYQSAWQNLKKLDAYVK